MASGSLAIHEVLPPEQNAEPSPVTTTARTERSAASSSMARDPGVGHLVGHRVALVGVVEGEHGDALGGALEAQVGEFGHAHNVLRPAARHRDAVHALAVRLLRLSPGVP